ncbi:MAG: AMP-binding protein [Cyanobacteriota bacterium]|nr:AMP-binding protein [Cyanobacteriota bacterium]
MTLAKSSLSIYHLLEVSAKKNPENIAILAAQKSPLNYGGLLDAVDDVRSKLNAMGVGRNDRVAVVLPNGSEMAVAFLGVASCATCAPLNPNYRESEYDFYLSDLDAKALIFQQGIAADAVKVAKKRGIPLVELSPIEEAATGIFELKVEEAKNAIQSGIAQPDDVALVLHTSGTTSRPKMVPLTHSNLCTSAQNISLTLNLTRNDRCLNVMPLFHIHGLMGTLLSSLSVRASVVCTPGFYAPNFFEWVEELHPTWYSAVPTMHQAILARVENNREIIASSQIRLIRSSSAPLPPQIMTELEQVFNAPVIESYGMTEASHQMASNPLPPHKRKPGSVGIAAGPEVAIMDDKGELLLSGEVGEVVIRGANVTQGYENNPQANQKAFTNDWFRTGDNGYLDTDNYLFLKGRIKEIINRGGEKISPREVDEVLLDYPAIEQVVTFAAPHTLLGEDVAAVVVLKQGVSATELEIKEFAATKLADFKVPRVVLFVDEIPKGPTGKRQRIGLAQKLGLTASDPTETAKYVPPTTAIEEKLVQIWSEVLGVEKVGIKDNFFGLGGDSILATQIVNRVREVLQVELSFIFFFEQPTVASMAIKITQTQAEEVMSDELDDVLDNLESLSESEVKKLLGKM